MKHEKLLKSLFGESYNIEDSGEFFSGTGMVDDRMVTIIGTANHAEVGVKLLLDQAAVILDTLKIYPGRPIILLIDTQGQKLRHFDELLGLNRYMAHLGKCIELARQMSHPTIGIVYGEAVSGGFITSGLLADQCYALSDAMIRVMGLPAMARITRISLEKLKDLSKTNPVFAPGAENYYKMGAIQEVWEIDEQQNFAHKLTQALQTVSQKEDKRPEMGFARGGRKLANRIIQSILQES